MIALSALIALNLPVVARSFLTYWTQVENDKIYLVAVEIMAGMVLILAFNYLHNSIRDRTLAKMASGAGLTAFFPWRSFRAQGRIREFGLLPVSKTPS